VEAIKSPEKTEKLLGKSVFSKSTKEEVARLGFKTHKVMGYSIRNERYRFTVWMGNDFRSTQAYDEKLLIAAELYDYEKYQLEKVNVANNKAYATISNEMKAEMIVFSNRN